ncbi:MAG: protein kinase [Acidobacteria bacterium]|nr:protein kinase [Acidobacteriota bacterium]
MKPDRFQRVEAIYHAAVAREPGERAAFLDDACGDDQALRREVESLLAHEEEAKPFLSTPALEVAARLIENPREASDDSLTQQSQALVGAMIAHYRIIEKLGEGGMGVVYKARDTKLQRDVAIKVLPDAVAADPDRLARFEREARALAALNHPHICTLYDVGRDVPTNQAGVGEEGGHAGTPQGAAIDYLVMEHLEGETLAKRLEKRSSASTALRAAGKPPLRVEEALAIGAQIADAVAAAHEAGIIHRDLKPANIKVRDDGTVKVLDFGLAKMFGPPGDSNADPMNSPTVTARAMRMGLILGTAAYMAPEQARGKTVDRRADVWAFGVVLFEMLAGTRPFVGDDVTDVLAAVVGTEPDWNALPATTPPIVRRLLMRCLTKDPRQRLHDIADARLEIDDAIGRAAEPQSIAATAAPSRRRERIVWTIGVTVVALALVALASVAYFGRGSQPASAGVTRSLISVAPADQLRASNSMEGDGEGRPSRTAMALSPDGQSLVFSAIRGDKQQLFLRALDELEVVPMAGTEGADSPFFSPDGKWVGFWAKGALRKAPLSGGAATTICDTAAIYGASWGSNDTIVYARTRGGLWLIPSGGGTPQPLTTLDAKTGEYSHRLPQFLPDGQAVVFTTVRHGLPDWRDARLWIVSLTSGERRELGQGADARYASSGHLVFVRSGTLVAVPFDLTKKEVTGNSLTMLDDVMQAANMPNTSVETGAGQFSLSSSGSLVYLPGGIFPDAERTIISVDRAGAALRVLPGPLRPYQAPLLSPRDQSQLVVWTQGVDRRVWTYDIARGTLTPLTTAGRNSRAIWTPDGKRITFAGASAGADNLFWIPSDRSGPVERLTMSTNVQLPSSWSPDGRTLAFVELGGPTPSFDVMALSLDGDRRPTPILQTRASERYPEFSPDSRYLAYTSDESGRDEVYVQPYPGPGFRKQISTEGGYAPAWSRDARELFYAMSTGSNVRMTTRMMAVSITLTPSFEAGTPHKLFEGRYWMQVATRGYDVTADGRRFFLTQTKERPPLHVTQMILVQNWFEELKAKVPPGR